MKKYNVLFTLFIILFIGCKSKIDNRFTIFDTNGTLDGDELSTWVIFNYKLKQEIGNFTFYKQNEYFHKRPYNNKNIKYYAGKCYYFEYNSINSKYSKYSYYNYGVSDYRPFPPQNWYFKSDSVICIRGQESKIIYFSKDTIILSDLYFKNDTLQILSRVHSFDEDSIKFIDM